MSSSSDSILCWILARFLCCAALFLLLSFLIVAEDVLRRLLSPFALFLRGCDSLAVVDVDDDKVV